jgi:hypothetical protein
MNTFDDLTDPFMPVGFDEIFRTATAKMVTEARVKAVLLAYERAMTENAQLPTYLVATLEGLRRV